MTYRPWLEQEIRGSEEEGPLSWPMESSVEADPHPPSFHPPYATHHPLTQLTFPSSVM